MGIVLGLRSVKLHLLCATNRVPISYELTPANTADLCLTEELVAEADLGGEVARKLLVSSEEMTPNEMVRNARRAEEAGFTTAWISDHYHPWIDAQGQSPFVWSVIGGIATATEGIRLGTGVTCPTMRIHPAIIAQATATSAAMLEGFFRFFEKEILPELR